MIGQFLKAVARQAHEMYGAIIFVPVISEDHHFGYIIDRTFSWIDSISYVALRIFLLYTAYHFLVKFW